MKLPQVITEVRIEVADRDSAIWQRDEIVRAIEKSVSLMSRLIPKKGILETTVVRTITGETLSIASDSGTLANRPVKPNSLIIPNKNQDVDYRVNYLTGRVTEIGSGLPDGDYTVGYDLDPYMLDISSLLTDYIKIDRVEYPVGSNPISMLAYDLYGDILVIRGVNTSLTQDSHLRVIYQGKWTPPTDAAAGDYPSHLNDVIIIGSAGQALIFKAEQYTHLSVTTLGNAVTEIGNIAAITFPSTPDLSSDIAEVKSNLDAIAAIIFPTMPDVDTDLAEIKSLIDSIASITLPVAPDVSAHITNAQTALTNATTRLAAAITDLADMDALLGDAETSLDDIAGEIADGDAFLTSGEPKINKVNVGNNVGEIYGAYAGYAAQLAQRLAEAGAGYTNLALAYEAKTGRQTAVANGYIQESVGHISLITRLLENYEIEARVVTEKVNYYNAQLRKADQKLTLVGMILKSAETEATVSSQTVVYYRAQIEKAVAKLSVIDKTLKAFETEATVAAQKVNYYTAQLNKAVQLTNVSAQYLTTAGRYLASGQAKINEFLAALGFKPELHSQKALAGQRE